MIKIKNDKIKEFALKSGFREDSHGIYTPGVDGAPLDDELKLFALWIIAECSQVIINEDSVGEEKQCTPLEIVKMIEEHFGIES